ncbi:MAG: YkgJ family cysteine cluster protein [Gammaproteobacteria bacterium]|nr:YkgJ family cysteine cluster protein [Gammaproteobacteria bacterium]
MTWECKKCGACCELLPITFFGKPCVNYDSKNRLCKIYENRPAICRVSHALGEDVTEKMCEFLRKTR